MNAITVCDDAVVRLVVERTDCGTVRIVQTWKTWHPVPAGDLGRVTHRARIEEVEVLLGELPALITALTKVSR